jgi:hypothetical protein
MNSKRLNWIISLAAIVALVRMWPVGGGIWWIILFLLLVNLFVGATAAKAVEIESKDYVLKFWRRVQLFVNCVCFTVSFAAILYSFR